MKMMVAIFALVSLSVSAHASGHKHTKRSTTAEEAYSAAVMSKLNAESSAADNEYNVRHRNNINRELQRLGLNPGDFKEQGEYVMSRSIVCSEGHRLERKAAYENYSNQECAEADESMNGGTNPCYGQLLELNCMNRTK